MNYANYPPLPEPGICEVVVTGGVCEGYREDQVREVQRRMARACYRVILDAHCLPEEGLDFGLAARVIRRKFGPFDE